MNDLDLIVVGGGLAGLSAAARAAELGLRTVVMEQGTEERYLCNSRMSGGILHLAMHDPYRPPHELVAAVKRQTSEADEQLLYALAGTGKRLIDWLQGQGARFMRFGPQESYRWCMAPPRALAAGMDWKDRGPDRVLQALERRFVERGGTFRRGTRVDSLRMADGRCVGVVATDESGAKDWSSRCVLLADGGFQSNPELFKRYIGPNFDRVFQRGGRTGVGAGLAMALAVGAAMKGSGFYGHLLSRDSYDTDRVWPYPQMDMISTTGIVVDGEGRRVADEGRGGVFLTNTLAKLSPDRIFSVCDFTIWDGLGKTDRIPANPHLENAGGTIHVADTIAGLAEKMGVPAAALEKTIADYNAAFKAGTLESLPVPRSAKKVAPNPIVQGPFRAIPVVPGITYTMGGIVIDENAQVLHQDGEPIPGLLAAGATTGGIEGGSNVAYLGGLLKAGVFGLVAAERAGVLVGKSEPAARAPARYAGPEMSDEPVQQKQGLNRFPVLRAVSRHGIVGAVVLGVLVAALIGWFAMPLIGVYSIPLGLVVGAGIGLFVASFTELIRLITELLIPE